MAKTTKAPATLDEMLAKRLEMIQEREQLRERLRLLTRDIDAAIEATRGDEILDRLSPRDRDLLAQAIRTRGIESTETVNG